jgi:hypothetical protein
VEEFLVGHMPGKTNIADLAKGNYIHTPSVVYRYDINVIEKYKRMSHCMPGDYVLWMLLAEKGYIYKMDDSMAVYRYGSGVWTKNSGAMNILSMIKTLVKLTMVLNKDISNLIEEYQVSPLSKVMINYETDTKKVRQSHAYKLGRIILKPFVLIKNIFSWAVSNILCKR